MLGCHLSPTLKREAGVINCKQSMSALNDSLTHSSGSLLLGIGENQVWQINAPALTTLPTLQKRSLIV